MKYVLGLDIGATSIGWAVLNEDKKRIENLGVRIFECPENPKNGESLAKPRRDARSTRRRLKRRRQRLNYLKRFFIEKELLTADEVASLLAPKNKIDSENYNPYRLRSKAISEKIPNDKLFVALYHIAKRRGYKSNRKKVEENSAENGRVLKAINENSKLLKDYQSIAKALLNDDRFKKHKRNKLDSYDNSFIREDFEKEIIAILKAQQWPDSWISDLIYSEPNGLFYQRPFMTPELIEKMRGKCPLEKTEPRAQKASYSFELFRLAQDLSHITYNDGNKLTPEQISLAVEKAKNTASVKYKALRDAVGFKNDPDFKFDYIRGKQEKDYSAMEDHLFCNLKFYHSIKKACSDADWTRVEKDIDLFDEIGYILTANKDDHSVQEKLAALELSQETIENLLKLSFSGFAGHSIKAIRKLTPHLLQGMTYDKAVEAEYPGEFNEKLSGDKSELPPLSGEQLAEITNPVVKRAIGQTRKVVNAVIKKYGAPSQIKIECANELAKSFEKRREIKKQQDENAENNEKIYAKLQDLGIASPSGQQITKYKLREQQLCKCVYCGKALGEETLTDEQLADVDHIIPFSRCGNDGLNNKVIVCAECNREKSNMTPFEKWGHDETKWAKISEIVEASNMPPLKKKRVLSEKIPKEEWNIHALNDTRYITKFISRYIKSNLKFSEDTKGKQKVLLPTGSITSTLRKMYHIGSKDRDLNNCHHAVDACIIASVSQLQIQKFAEYSKLRELGIKQPADILPWERFDDEVRIRSGMSFEPGHVEKLTDFRDKFRDFKNYDEGFLNAIHPLFVSRMPKRSAKGKAHKETIRSPKSKDGGRRLTRERLADCTLDDIENSVLPESDRKLYEQLKILWNKKGEDAFKEPVYKGGKSIDKNGNPISPVTTIKVYSNEPSGLLINNDTQFVNNGKQIGINIYKRKDKYFVAPVYVHSARSKDVAILPTPVGRSQADKTDMDSIRSGDGKIYAKSENGFELVTTLSQNDYVKIIEPNKIFEGYYVTYDIDSGRLVLVAHNETSKKSSNEIRRSVGRAIDIKKLNISILGEGYTED